MKYLLLTAVLFTNIAFAGDTWVDGYTRKDGTYVQGYHRSTPDSNPYNNYSTQGNTNPYTGKEGTVNPYPTYQTQPQQRCTKDYLGNVTCY